VGSLYIQGEETLGMIPETQDKSYPLYGKIAAPRMLVAQFDNLVYNAVLETYREKLLRDLDWLFSQDKRRWWFTIYVIVFILLREVSRMTADRYRHARENFGTMVSAARLDSHPRHSFLSPQSFESSRSGTHQNWFVITRLTNYSRGILFPQSSRPSI